MLLPGDRREVAGERGLERTRMTRTKRDRLTPYRENMKALLATTQGGAE